MLLNTAAVQALILSGGAEAEAKQRGFLLLDALLAAFLTSLVVVVVAGLLHASVRAMRETGRLDRAREAVVHVDRELDRISYERLIDFFGTNWSNDGAVLSTEDGSAPPRWRLLLADLPRGQLEARIQGMGLNGTTRSFERSIAIRVRVGVEFDSPAGRRSVTLTSARF